MNQKADAVIQNIGAAAEATALFYNTIVKQVPPAVALELTKQYMAVVYQNVHPVPLRIPASVLQAAIEKAAEESRRRHQQEQEEKEAQEEDND